MLKDKVVCITGASAGIGEACAHVFARARARLILVARREERLRQVAAELSVPVTILQADVRDRQALQAAFDSLDPEWRSIDVLINNAGLSRGLQPIQSGSWEDWDEMIETNVKGLLNVTRMLLPGMVSRAQGTVVNVSSIAGRQTYPNGNVYCASKHAVRALSESMQLDLLGTGVRVTNIDPGMVETEFSLVRFRGDAERAAKTYTGMQPLRAEDIAETILFCVTRPPHVSIHDLLIMPSDQASTTMVHRRAT